MGGTLLGLIDAEDDTAAGQLILVEACLPHGGTVPGLGPFRKGDVHNVVRREVGSENDVEEAAILLLEHVLGSAGSRSVARPSACMMRIPPSFSVIRKLPSGRKARDHGAASGGPIASTS